MIFEIHKANERSDSLIFDKDICDLPMVSGYNSSRDISSEMFALIGLCAADQAYQVGSIQTLKCLYNKDENTIHIGELSRWCDLLYGFRLVGIKKDLVESITFYRDDTLVSRWINTSEKNETSVVQQLNHIFPFMSKWKAHPIVRMQYATNPNIIVKFKEQLPDMFSNVHVELHGSMLQMEERKKLANEPFSEDNETDCFLHNDSSFEPICINAKTKCWSCISQ